MIKTIRNTALVGMLACSVFTASAEEGNLNDWSFGVHVGAANPWMYGNKEKAILLNNKEFKPNTFNLWFCGALHGSWAFSEYAGVGMEVAYKKCGSKFEEKEGDNDKKHKGSMFTHTISLPIMVQLYPLGRQEEEGILGINLGWIPNYVLSKKVNTQAPSGSGSNGETDVTDDFKDKIQNMNLGTFGGGIFYELPFGLIISANYHISFANSFKDDDNNDVEKGGIKVEKNAKWKSQYAEIRVGYNFARLL